MENQLKITYLNGTIVPSTGVTTIKTEMLLSASEMEQIRTALNNGKGIIKSTLNRTKKSAKRITRTFEQNAVDSVLYKLDHAKPEKLYAVGLLDVEIEAAIYCLEHSKNKNSRATQSLLATLNSYLYDCGK